MENNLIVAAACRGIVLFIAGRVKVGIFNICGEKIATLFDGCLSPDTYTLEWDGKTDSGLPAPSGVYFCRLVTGHARLTDKIVLMR